MAACYKVSPITCPLNLAKGPHWDACTETLYCVDIFKGSVHSYKPSTCQFSTATVGDGKSPMAVIVPVTGEKNKYLVSMKNDVATICWDGLSETTSTPEVVASAEPACNYNRLNNGKVDPCGRLWAGTTGRRLHPTELEFEEDVGSLYCFEKGGKVSKKLDKITISNGLEWSADSKKFFYVDSIKYNVVAYDYDNASGNICNPKEIFSTKENDIPGLLDAMAIDTAGRLYIANYVGCQVVVIDSNTGQLVDKIPIPAEEVTSCAFGGPNLDILYVTTGNTNPNPKLPIAGRIFQVTGLGAKGYAGRSVVLNDVKVEHVTDIPLKRGRSISWNANEQALFYVDSALANIHSYKPSTKTLQSAAIAKGEENGFLLPIVGQKGSFLIGQKNSIANVSWDGLNSSTEEPEILTTLQNEKKENTIISGKVDTHGQIWIGTAQNTATMRNLGKVNSTGNVYQLSNNCREVTKQLENIDFPIDFEWSLDGKVMYFIDSTKLLVEAFDLNPRTGLIAFFRSRQIFNLVDSRIPGFMSALTIDRNERLYVAVYSLGQVLVINPINGKLLKRIIIPNTEVVSCTFGGTNLDILYVITCNSASETNFGKLFQVFNLGCQGYSTRGAIMDDSLKVEHLVNGLSQPRGIRWNIESRSLQFADSAKGTIHNFCPLSRTLSTATIGKGTELTGIILPIAGQKDVYAISAGMDIFIAKWDGNSQEVSSSVRLTNFSNYEAFDNSGKNWICSGNVDYRGNLWAGTTGKHPDNSKDNFSNTVGNIYSVQKDMQVMRKIADISLPCGFEWSQDERKFYYVDALRFTIEVCDYNEDTGELSRSRELFRLIDHKIPGLLGGMTMDTNGILYVANYFGGQVLVVDSITGKLIKTIKIAANEVLGCTIGGLNNMDTLYVVTGHSESNKQSGSIYKVTNIGVKGYASRSVVMENSLRTESITPALTYGKGCFWDDDQHLLYFSDSSQGTIHSYNPSTDQFVTAKVNGVKSNTNMIIPLKGLKNKFLLGLDNELCIVNWNGRSSETTTPEKSIFVDKRFGIRFNTGKIDSRGRLWAGTTSTESSGLLLQSGEGTLYCVDRFRIVEKFTSLAKVSGLEWSSDNKKMFLVDTIKSRVESYDYDVKTGSVCNGKVIFKLAELKRGLLYSMTIDLNDTLYVCNNHGCQILMIDSVTGKLIRTVSVPAMEILSCAFGGANLDTLYVTTGNTNPCSEFPHAGRVFAITNLGVRGVPSNKFIIDGSIRAEPVTNWFTFASSPHWNADTQVLYSVAGQGATPLLCRYSPSTSKCYSAVVGNGTHMPAMVIPVSNQKETFIVSIQNQLALVTWDGFSRQTSEPCFIAECQINQNEKRLSVGKVDPQGRLWSGTTRNGLPFCKEVEEIVEQSFQSGEKTANSAGNYETSAFTNGLEWSLDSKKFFYVDSANAGVDSFDFDSKTGLISNRKCVFSLNDHKLTGSLDSMTIDVDGHLYIAHNMGSQILVVNPENGALLSKIAIPAAEITGCVFGGANLDILYVTTGGSCSNSHPNAGNLFQVKNLGVHGLPGRSVVL